MVRWDGQSDKRGGMRESWRGEPTGSDRLYRLIANKYYDEYINTLYKQ